MKLKELERFGLCDAEARFIFRMSQCDRSGPAEILQQIAESGVARSLFLSPANGQLN